MKMVLKIIMLVIAVIVVAVIAVRGLVHYIAIPTEKTRDVWSSACGNDGEKLVIINNYYKNPWASTYNSLFVTLRNSSSKELFRVKISDFTYLPFGVDKDSFTLFPLQKDSKNMGIIFEGDGVENYDSRGHSNKVSNAQYQSVRNCFILNKTEIEKSINDFRKDGNYNIVALIYQEAPFEMRFQNKAFSGAYIHLNNEATVEYRVPEDKVIHSNSWSDYDGENLGDLFSLEKTLINDRLVERIKNLREDSGSDESVQAQEYSKKYTEASISSLEFLSKNIDTLVNSDGQNIFQYRDVVLEKLKDVPKEYLMYSLPGKSLVDKLGL